MSNYQITENDIVCAVVESHSLVIADTQSALGILMMAKYETGTKNK